MGAVSRDFRRCCLSLDRVLLRSCGIARLCGSSARAYTWAAVYFEHARRVRESSSGCIAGCNVGVCTSSCGYGEGIAQKTVVGIDGQWVGENQNESWFSVQIEPGVHHVCVSSRAHFGGQVVELAHITAEAGRTYYFRTRDFMWQTRRLKFGPVDSDQAKYMIASYPMAVSQAKK